MALEQLLTSMLQNKASDLHVTAGSPPTFRVHGNLIRAKMPPLTPDETKAVCFSVLSESQKEEFQKNRQVDLSFTVNSVARFRANIFFQRGAVAGAFRYIPIDIPKMEKLGLPTAVGNLMRRPRGLFLVTGATGSGKSTTLASIIDALNDSDSLHIITIEDPIEYIHKHKNCLVNQREVNEDTKSFAGALRAALREDPDVVLVGEMRDLEAIETALTLAETGHLVLSTLHTNSAYQSITRMIQVFPSTAQDQIRLQLSMVLEGVLTQNLIPRADGQGRVLALELMVANASIRNLIRENKLHQVQSAMLMGQDQSGMITMNQSLYQLAKRGVISRQTALETSPDADDLSKQLSDIRKAG